MICFWKSTGEHFHYFILLLILFIDSAPLKSTFCNQRPMCIIIQIICWLYNTNKTDFTSYYDIWCDSCQYVDKCCHLSTYWQPMMTVDIWLSNPDIDLSNGRINELGKQGKIFISYYHCPYLRPNQQNWELSELCIGTWWNRVVPSKSRLHRFHQKCRQEKEHRNLLIWFHPIIRRSRAMWTFSATYVR